MEVNELKIVLDLLGYPPDYCVSPSQLASSRRRSDRDRAIRQLCDRGFVAYSEKIVRFRTAPPGKALLKLEFVDGLPIHEADREVLRQADGTYLTPSQLQHPNGDPQEQLRSLHQRGLIQAETKIHQLWITPAGKHYLRNVYLPEGEANVVLSPALLGNYLRFLRKPDFLDERSPAHTSASAATSQLTDDLLIATIQELDQIFNTANYVPLFYLRQRLEPLYARTEVDQVLYRLQRQDALILSSVQDVAGYTPEQLQAGIPQDIGGPLFFVSLTEREA